MKTKLIIAVLALLAVMVGAILLVPQFIDWNEYKGAIAARAEEATGRAVTIGGDIELTLVPTPAVVVEDLKIANLQGGVAADLLRLKRAEVEVAFLPLLSGRLEVQRVRLVEPVVALEILENGRANWSFEGDSAEAASGESATIELPPAEASREQAEIPSPRTDPTATGNLPYVRLDAVEVEDGVIIYRDLGAAFSERIQNLNATIRAGSLQGPYDSRGAFVLNAKPVTYDLAIGRLDPGTSAAVPVRLVMTTPYGNSRIQVDGSLAAWTTSPRFRGEVLAEAADLAAAVQAWLPQPLPGLMAQPASVRFEIEASTAEASVAPLTIRLGDTTAEGAATVAFETVPVLALQLVAGRIDLEAWLEAARVPPRGPAPPSGDASSPEGTAPEGMAPEGMAPEGMAPGETLSASPPGHEDGAGPPGTSGREDGDGTGGLVLPTGIAASISLSAEAMTFKGGIIRQARVSFDLSQDGVLTIRQFAALFPGGADAMVSGTLTGGGGALVFEGRAEARAADLRAVLAWLDVAPEELPPGRLRAFAFAGGIFATAETVRLKDFNLHVDSSRLSGDAAVTLDERPRILADVAVDRVNLDAYLPAADIAAAPTEDTDASNRDGPEEGAGGVPAPVDAGETTPAAAFAHFDADVTIRIDVLTYRDTPAQDVIVSGALTHGVVTVHEAAVGDYAGAAASVAGTLRPLTDPLVMEDMAFTADVPDVPRLARAVGIHAMPLSGPQLEALGAITAKGTVSGETNDPHVDLTIRAADAEIALVGQVDPPGDPLYQGRIRVTSQDPRALLTALGVGAAHGERLGATDLAAQVTVADGRLAASQLAGEVGGIPVSGFLSVTLTSRRPTVSANLQTGRLILESLLPAQRASGLRRPSEHDLVPVRWRPPPPLRHGWPGDPRRNARLTPIAAEGPWSPEPFDLTALRTFDADLSLEADGLVYQGYALDEATLRATLTAGVLTIGTLTGTLYGGPVAADGKVDASDARAVPAFAANIQIDDADIVRAPAVSDGLAGGRLTLETKLASRGQSVADIVSALSGNGSFALRGLDPRYEASQIPVVGPILGSAVQLVGAINANLIPLLGPLSGRQGPGLADITSPFAVTRGVARFDPIVIDTGVYQGRAQGTADLPAWQLDMAGQLRLSESTLGRLLSRVEDVPLGCSFTARGALDRPDISLGRDCLPAKLTIPGGSDDLGEDLERLIPDELGPLKEKLTAPETQKEPEKVIKNLLEGFGGFLKQR